MENVIKKLFLGGSLLTALAVSLTALGVYAADLPKNITEEVCTGEGDQRVCQTIITTNYTDCDAFLTDTYDRNADGSIKTDANGQPIMVTSAASEALAQACKDGTLVDSDGTKIDVVDRKDASADATSKFTIKVPKTIILTNVTDGIIGNDAVQYDAINKTTISATVQSNTPYALYLSAIQPNLINESANQYNIPATSAVAAGKSGWGIMKKADESADGGAGTYTAITDKLQKFYASDTITDSSAAITTNGEVTTFNVGVGVANDQTAGTYSTTVTVTASTSLELEGTTTTD